MKTEEEIAKYKEDITQNEPLVYNPYLQGFVHALEWVLSETKDVKPQRKENHEQ